MERFDRTRYAVGVDVGGSHLCSAVVDLETGTVCGEPLATQVDCMASAGEILDRWSENIRRTIAGFDRGPLTRIGMAVPGPFDYVQGISLIRGVCKYDRIFGLDVGESLRSVLPADGAYEFRFVNDASAFALGECLGGAARGSDRVVALTLGTGVGSGFVEACRLVEDDERVPAHGWVYCLPFEGGIVDDAFSTRWVCRRYRELAGCEVAGAREVAERVAADAAARTVFEEYGHRLATFAGPVLDRFGARTLVLGGNIARAYPCFGPSLEASFAASGRSVETRLSQLMDHAALIGAASLFK